MHFTFIRNSDIDIAIFCKYRIEASLLGADASPAGASGTQIQPFGVGRRVQNIAMQTIL